MKIPYRTKTQVIDLDNLSESNISPVDIACSLAGQSRFNGNTRPLYTVAQHSVMCSILAPEGLSLAALLHDAHEYLMGDIATPVQQFVERGLSPGSPINDAKESIDRLIGSRFGVNPELFHSDAVMEIDKRMLATEMVFLMGKNYTEYDPYNALLTESWSTKRSEMEFIFELERLTRKCQKK